MDLKSQVLDSYVRIEELPVNSCFKTFNKDLYDGMDRPDIYFFEMQGGGLKLSISVQLDKLLGQWIKIKESINYPSNERILTILLLQRMWFNDYFKIAISDEWTMEPNSRTIFFYQPDHYYCRIGNLELLSVSRRWAYDDIAFYMDCRLPFLFIEIMTQCEPKILTLQDIQIEIADPNCNRQVHLSPTSNPKIYLLILSDVLETERDCKKIVRRYLTTPNHPVWTKYDFMPHMIVHWQSLRRDLRLTTLHHEYTFNSDSSAVRIGDEVSSRIDDDILLQTYLNTQSPSVARSTIYSILNFNNDAE